MPARRPPGTVIEVAMRLSEKRACSNFCPRKGSDPKVAQPIWNPRFSVFLFFLFLPLAPTGISAMHFQASQMRPFAFLAGGVEIAGTISHGVSVMPSCSGIRRGETTPH